MDNQIQEYINTHGAEIGGGFIIGLAVGYFTKKLVKLALLIAGFALVVLFVTEYYEITEINEQNLKDYTEATASKGKGYIDILKERLSKITTKGLSTTAGFFTGLKIG